MRRLAFALVLLVALTAAACTNIYWSDGPSGGSSGPPILPPPTPTAMATCDIPQPMGWIFVKFPNDISPEHAEEIVESVEGAYVVHVELMMNPIAWPIPSPDIEGYWLVVGVPEDKEELYVSIFNDHPDVLQARLAWPGCPPFMG